MSHPDILPTLALLDTIDEPSESASVNYFDTLCFFNN